MIHSSPEEFEGCGPAPVCFVYPEVKHITCLVCFVEHSCREVNDADQPYDGFLLAGHKVPCIPGQAAVEGY